LVIDLRLGAFQLCGFFEEGFDGYGKEFLVPFRAIGVDQSIAARFDIVAVALVSLDEDTRPVGEALIAKRGRAVGMAREIIQLVGEFMDHHVVAVLMIARALVAVLPRQDDRAARPAFAGAHDIAFGDDIAIVHLLAGFEGPRIDEDGGQVAVPRGGVGNEKTGLGRDGKAYFAGDLKPVAAVELHLVKEEVDLAFECRAQIGGQFLGKGNVVGHDGTVVIGEGRGEQGRAGLFFLLAAVQDPAQDEQRKGEA